jgi:hypothetical protein
MRCAYLGVGLTFSYDKSKGETMGEIGEPDRVIRRERDPVITPAIPVPTPELEPAK